MTIETDLRAVADAVRARIPELVSAIERMSLQEVPEIHEKDDPVLAEQNVPASSLR
jgi:hypothetical protein